MGEIIHGINMPFIAGFVVVSMTYAVKGGVAHDDVRGSHIYFSPQNHLSVGKFPCLHTSEKVEVFLNGAVAVRAFFAGLGKRAAVFADLVGVQFTNIGFAPFDQLFGKFIQPVKIIGSVMDVARPAEAEPFHIFLY